MRLFRSVFFYVMLVVSTILCGSMAIVLFHITGGNEKSHLMGRLWGNINLWTAGVKVRMRGLENIDTEGAYIYAANHQSWFDIFALLGKLPIQFRWLAKEELFSLFVLGRAMRATGYIPIDRSDRRKAFDILNRAARMVRDGTSIVIFPEGTRSPDGVLQDFKKGGFILAIKSQQPIVPISISGSYRVLPKKGGWMLNPGTMHITVGVPIPTEGATTQDRDRLMSEVREGIRKHLTVREGGVLPDEEPSRACAVSTA